MSFKKKISLGKYTITSDSPTFIIAEAGVNHNGDISIAKKLIDVAKTAGANAVKFQAFIPKNLILPKVVKAPYQKATTNKKESQIEMLQKLQLKQQHYKILKDYCEEQGIIFLITPFDEESLKELEAIGVIAYKVASTDTTNLPFLKKIAQTGKPIILSTGMCYMEEVRLALATIQPINNTIILLQCTANYPIRNEEANLNVITTFKKEFDILVGYSDHSVGVGASPYAVAMGAKVIEKHFTLDKSIEGPDHKASLSPKELEAFVKEVRKVESFISDDGHKKPSLSETATRKALQKCLVANREIKVGSIIEEGAIIGKRTGGEGISPIYYESIIGQKAKKTFYPDDIIEI